MPRKIILLEANEIPYQVLDDFVAQAPNSKLAGALPRCHQRTTLAADTCDLSPWITWPTLHRGVNNEAHQILNFGQDLGEIDARYPPIWQLLARNGVSTGVFGPLHSSPLPENVDDFAFFLPDTFAASPESSSPGLTAFQNFNLIMSRDSPRNVSGGVDLGSLFRFLLRAPGLGLRPRTLLSIARQLVDEQSAGWKKTRRRTYQPVLAFDLFIKQLRVHRPQFANFFTNHVASAMHRYWAARYPQQFDDLELGSSWQEQYGGEIDFAMRWLDHMFGRLAAFADRNPEYLLIVASSMGQAAASGSRMDSQLYLRDIGKLMTYAGFDRAEWEQRPSMAPTVSVVIKGDGAARFARFMDTVRIEDEKAKVGAMPGGFFDLCFGQPNLDPLEDCVMIAGKRVAFDEIGFECTKIDDEAGSTGYHVPEGTFYIYDPADATPKEGRPELLTTEIAPALLRHFGVDIPDYMGEPPTLELGKAA
jgi:hypothetical protein